MHILARGSDGALWDNVDGTWQNRSGMIESDVRPIINPFNPGFIYTTACGADGALWINALDTASGNCSWNNLAGTMEGAPSPSVDSNGVLHNFVQGNDGNLWDNAGGNWYCLGGVNISGPCAFRDREGKLHIAVAGEKNELQVNTIGTGMAPTTLVGSFACDDSKIQSAIDAIVPGGIVKVLSGNFSENVIINKELTFLGSGNVTVASITLNCTLGANSGGITAPVVIVNAGSSILEAIELASSGASIRVNGAVGYTYDDDLNQSFYAKGITLTGIDNPVTKSISLDRDVAGKISCISANTVEVNPGARILQAIELANTCAQVMVNGSAEYIYDDDLDQSFYVKGIILIGIDNPVIRSLTLNHDVAGTISGIAANTVNVNPDARIREAIELANAGARVIVNGANGYTYSDDLTQGFYTKSITLNGINSPATKSISLDRAVAGKISGIAANTVNVNPGAGIQQAIELANAGASVKVNGSEGHIYSDDLTQGFYEKGITLTGINDPVAKSITLNRAVAGKIGGIAANSANISGPDARIQDGISLVQSGGTVRVNAGNYLEDLDINKNIILSGSGNSTVRSISLHASLGEKPFGIYASNVTVFPPSRILDGILMSSRNVYVNGASGFSYGDDLTQSFYEKGIILTGISNPVTKSISLDRAVAGKISGIAANSVNVNPGGGILQAIELANAGASVKVNGSEGHIYSDDLTQGFYEKGITLTGINNPVAKSITLNRAVAGKISGIAVNSANISSQDARIQDGIALVQSSGTVWVSAGNYLEDIDINKSVILSGIGNSAVRSISLRASLKEKPSGIYASNVTVFPPSRILDGILMSSKDVYVNGASGYVYGDDLTQGFYEQGITLTGINNPVTKSISLDRAVAGKISGIAANTVNVNPGGGIQQAIELANAGASVKVNGSEGHIYSDDLTQSFYEKEITLTGLDGPVTKSISLDRNVAGKINGIAAYIVNVNPDGSILQGIDLAKAGASVNVNGSVGYIYSDDLNQSFYEKGIALTGINGPVTESISLDRDVAGKISGIAGNTVNVNPGASILQGIDLANASASVNVNGSDGYTYSDDLTQSFYEKGVALTGINGPVTESISLDRDVAGKIGGIAANAVNVLNQNARIQDAILLVSSAGRVNVASGTYRENIIVNRSLTVDGAGAGSCIVDGNKKGSVIIADKDGIHADITLSAMTLTNGTGTADAGRTYGGGILNYGNLIVTDCVVSESTANCGGGIQNFGIATIADSTVSRNIAQTDGGGISSSGILNLEDGSITGNIAVWGGGISSSGTMTLKSGIISENTATEGGGIRNSGTMTLKSGIIAENNANVSGGGIGNSGTVNLGGGSISGNKAVYGGGIGNSGTLTLNSGIIAENTATNGGGIFSDNHGTMNLEGGSIDRNIANVSGGGIYSLGGTVNIDGSIIDRNIANVSGGGIYGNSYVTVNLFGGEILENFAMYYGGGIYSQGTAYLHGGNVTGNIASDGGGIFSSGFITMNGGSIYGNAAKNGSGGGCFNAGTMDLSGGIIAENTAINGGGIYSAVNSHIVFDGMQVFIKSNQAHLPSPSESSWYQGWGVFLEEGTPVAKGNFNQTIQVTGNIRI
ncbi:MAG: hypothetical protein PHQ34_02295 [Methanothrix sp.]|nr:hypothetical protein [Methanothrix sp.]